MMRSARLILTPIPLSNIPCPCDRSHLFAYIEQDGLMLDPSPGRIRCHCTRPGDDLGDVHGALQVRAARLMEIDCEARQFNESDAMVTSSLLSHTAENGEPFYAPAGAAERWLTVMPTLYGTSRSWLPGWRWSDRGAVASDGR
jgi:hypothetical protein